MTEKRDFVCIFRPINASSEGPSDSPPERDGLKTFSCVAVSGDEAEQRCMAQATCHAVLDVFESDDSQGSLDAYFEGLLRVGAWVIYHDGGDSGAATVTGYEGEIVFLESVDGRRFEAPRDCLSPSRPMVPVEDLQAELEKLTALAHSLIDTTMMSRGDKSDDCQRMLLVNNLVRFEQSVNGLADSDIKRTRGYGSAVMARFRFCPEAVSDDRFIPVDVPDGQSPAWTVPLCEISAYLNQPVSRERLASMGDLDFARHVGNAPAWVRAWPGPFTIRLDGFQ